MKFYLGLDVHSKMTSFCLQDETGSLIAEGNIPSTPQAFAAMKEIHSIPDGTQAGLESGTQALVTVRMLYDIDLEPVVINAEEVRRKARRVGQKTDKRDAFEICDGLRRGIYDSIVYVPEPRIARVRAVLSRRRHYAKLLTMEVNTAKFVYRAAGYGSILRSLTTEKAWEALLLHPAPPEELREDVRRHFKTWQHAKAMVKEIEAELVAALKPFEKIIHRLRSVPGVGLLTAATYFSTIGRIDRFPDSDHVVSYLGLAPSMYDSGATERRGGITKRGSTATRSILCEAAHQAARTLHPLRPYFMRIMAKRDRKRAIVAVAHRLARILYQVWKKDEDFDASKLNVEKVTVERVEEKFVLKTKTKAKG